MTAEAVQAESVNNGREVLKEEMVALMRALQRHPDIVDGLRWLVAVEDPDGPRFATIADEWARAYLAQAMLGWCSRCHAATVLYPDFKQLDWPSLDKHECQAVVTERNGARSAFE